MPKDYFSKHGGPVCKHGNPLLLKTSIPSGATCICCGYEYLVKFPDLPTYSRCVCHRCTDEEVIRKIYPNEYR